MKASKRFGAWAIVYDRSDRKGFDMQRAFFLRATLPQATIETLLLSLLLWVCVFLFRNATNSITEQAIAILTVSAIPVCYCVLRLEVPHGTWWRQCRFEILFILVFGCVLGAIDIVFSFMLINRFVPTSPRETLVNLLGYTAVAALANGSLFLTLRWSARVLLFWNRLRRRQLLWSLTHAHVMVVALGAGMMILLIEGVFIINTIHVSKLTNLTTIVPVTVVLVILSVIALVAVVPPSALFSYIVMRRTTSRIKSLAAAASALRAGNYRVRVPVIGEDELAQLQGDFNAMAATLEQTMGQLREEHDTVSGLLQSRRELIANVSHELRTPVATLRSYIETTLMHWNAHTNPPTTLHHDMQIMENEVIRLQGLIEDLFTLSRAEVGKLTLRCEPTEIGTLVQRIVDARAPMSWQASKVETIADIAPSLPLASVDASRLEQVLHNLLHNAVRHTPPGGIVAIAVTAEPDMLAIQVKDTGEGIAPEDIPHIWERFYQSKSSRSGGAGLGLALVKELVEGMQGTAAVESTPGEGSCFTIRLPQANTVDVINLPTRGPDTHKNVSEHLA